jgi:glycosyltransferase involved in cell wall biosynthesis
LLTTHSPGDDPQALRERLPDCKSIVSFPYATPKWNSWKFPFLLLRSWFSRLPVDLWKCRVPELRDEVTRLMGKRSVDVCVADFMVAIANVKMNGPVPVVYFSHNVEYLIWRRLCDNEKRIWRRMLLEIEWRKMRRCEAATCEQAKLTVAVSAQDRDVLQLLAPDAAISDIPTGVDISYFAPHQNTEIPDRLVYLGSMDWYPNEDAVLYFIESILPAIRRECPEVSLFVVGRNPGRILQQAAALAEVKVTGTVDDIRPFLAQASVVIVPLRIGGGTRLKIFEAIAMGKSVVSTTIGAEGLPLVNGINFICADEPQMFADEVVALLRDPERRRRIGNAGQQLVEQHYSWNRVAEDFAALIQ